MTFNEANTVEAFVRDLLCGGVMDHLTNLNSYGIKNGFGSKEI